MSEAAAGGFRERLVRSWTTGGLLQFALAPTALIQYAAHLTLEPRFQLPDPDALGRLGEEMEVLSHRFLFRGLSDGTDEDFPALLRGLADRLKARGSDERWSAFARDLGELEAGLAERGRERELARVPPWGRGEIKKHFCAAGPFSPGPWPEITQKT